jgi:exosortase A
MSAVTEATESPPASPWGELRAVLPVLAVGLAALGVIFWREMTAAVEVWDASTAYNHCFLVIPIAAWMAWERRASVAYMPARPDMRAVVLALPLTIAWFVADRIGIMEGRQLAVIGLVEVFFLAVLGWDLFRRLSAPLLYLIFLVPFGAFLTPWLQDLTAWFTVVGLNTLGILHYTDGLVIEIQGGTFVIAEACAGLRFLIASIAFGTLYACTIYRSPARRVVFILVSIIVPIIANGFRALGIVAAGYWLGSAEAAAADHVIYGWVFFSFVTLLLILIGLPFRQDRVPEAMPVSPDIPTPSAGTGPALRVAFAVGLLAALGPGLALALDRGGRPVVNARAAPLMLGGDCQPVTPLPRRRPIAADLREALCAGGQVRVSVAVFAAHANPGQIVSAQRLLSGEDGADETDVSNLASEQPGGPVWRVVETHKPDGLYAVALWLDGKPGGFGLRARIVQAQASLGGAGMAPVLVAVAPATQSGTLTGSQRNQLRLGLTAFLRQRRDLPGRFAELSANPAQ